MPLPCSSVKWNRWEIENNYFPQLRCNCWFHLFLRAPQEQQAAVLKLEHLNCFVPSLFSQTEISLIQFVTTAALQPPGTDCTSLQVLRSPAPGQEFLCQALLAHPVLLIKVVSLGCSSSTWEGSTCFCCSSPQLWGHSKSLLPAGASLVPSYLGRNQALCWKQAYSSCQKAEFLDDTD